MSPHSSRPVVARALAAVLTALLAVTGISLPSFADDLPETPIAIEATDAPTESAASEVATVEEPVVDEAARAAAGAEESAPSIQALAAVVPTIVVSKTTGLVTGEKITVTGSGFSADAPATTAIRPPLVGRFGGVYVAFGKFAQNWRPSAGVPTAQRPTAAGLKWVMDAADAATYASMGGVAINPDGSFEVELTVTPAISGAIADGNFGVYTYPGGGATYPAFETYTPVSFAPTVVVSKTSGLTTGETVTVTGAGFEPSTDTNGTRPPLAGRFGGVYVAFGKFGQSWRPSAGVPLVQRPTAPGVKWAMSPADAITLVGGGGIAINADGSFTTTLTVTPVITGAIADGNFGVYTYPGSGAGVPRFETYTPMEFQVATPTPTPTTAPAPQTAGSLVWGVKASWRSYITGIAAGSITVTGGASGVGGGYSFPQSSAALDASGLGTAAYRGGVTFRGHDGALDVRLADPIVRVTSATSGVLSVVTYDGRVDFATLALGSGSRQVDGTGAILYSGVPATLTAAGAGAFDGQYPAGTALDSIAFTIGSTNATNGSTRVVAAAAVVATRTTPDATAPATDGVESEETEFTAGGTVTFTADGFQPGETGILAVIYSEPTLLADDLTADAAGTIAWTGNLPAGLTGEHTFTFQGSVDRGIVIQIAEAEVVGCTVEGAELDWGFKESFRAYIDGSIANGEWTTADGATYETPLFGFTGTGGYDAETGDADVAFAGSVRFTGHGGALDTTIANPRVVIDGERAVLLLDISGTTQSGETAAQTGVEFAELDLAAAEQGDGGDLVAFTGVPAVLTAAGAAAFGTYPAGEALDPLDLRMTVDSACVEPVAVVEDEAEVPTENGSAASPLPWILGGLVLLVAAVVLFLVRRNRTA